ARSRAAPRRGGRGGPGTGAPPAPPPAPAPRGPARRRWRERGGRRRGAPARGANAITGAVEPPNPPLHLLLGKDALRMAREKLEALRRDFDTWQNVTVGADFPAGEPTKVV